MRLIAAKQDLKLFQQQTSQPSFTPAAAAGAAAAATAATAANGDTNTAAHKQAEKEDAMVNTHLVLP